MRSGFEGDGCVDSLLRVGANRVRGGYSCSMTRTSRSTPQQGSSTYRHEEERYSPSVGKHDDIQSELEAYGDLLLTLVNMFEALDVAYSRRDHKSFQSTLRQFRSLAPKLDSLFASIGRMISEAIESFGVTNDIAIHDDRRTEFFDATVEFFGGVQESFARIAAADPRFARKVGL